MLPLVTDPWFYAVAVPAILITGLSKSGFASGFGSLSVPLMAMVIPVPQAAAIMLPLLMAMDATSLQQLWRHRDPALLKLLLPGGLVGIGVGWALFGWLSPTTVAGLTGLLTLLFLAHRLGVRPRSDGTRAPDWVGRLCAAGSGFTSFIAHAGNPPISAYLLPLRLAPAVFSGTMAVFFSVINASKWGPYAILGLIDARNMATALVLMPLAPLGVWIGVRLTHRVSPLWFYRIAYGGMGVSGCKLLWDGLRG